MSTKQDKATTERHSRTLRELLKNPDNKTCADCKRNDPRWASWNLGVFLCIRCSGIHRSMGTHISKVKSVDLDVWTPEQMASIQKWGNRRANAYWERHLRVGHIPPDHKMESYIRSKYESRRWALAEPVPEDPAVLDSIAPAPTPGTPVSAAPVSSPTHTSRASVSSLNATRTTQPQPHQLLSTAVAASRQATGSPAPALAPPQRQQSMPQPQAQQAPQPQSAAVDLFSLDFHAPTSASPPPAQQEQPKKDVKAEIMSLFSTGAPAAPVQQNAFGGGFGGHVAGAGAGLFGAAPAPQPQNQFGGLGAGMGGMGGMAAQANPWGGFGQPQQPAQQQQMPQQTSMIGNAGSNIWATPAPASQQSLFSTSDVWSTPATGGGGAPAAAAQKNNDAFGDLWGGFK
ncbi:putative GTPase activating protein for Arf-domain-containing protein [Daedaleopsis nitida]|nr:putative GTPase activating protein for Arf-domain-containing protein [Daedaleopsis nitida]